MRKATGASVAILLLLAASVPLALAQGTYANIDVPGSAFTYAWGINTAGEIVGTYDDRSGALHGFLLSGGTYTTIDYPGASDTGLIDINDKGQIVGETDSVGFLYDRNTGTFTDITFRGLFYYSDRHQ